MINKIKYTLDRGLAVYVWIIILNGIYQRSQGELTLFIFMYNIGGVIFLSIVFSLITTTILDEKYYSDKYFK
jgi:hypothetical protein